MSSKNELVKYNRNGLLKIFVKEEDRKGTDILAMSDFLKNILEILKET